ncbi:hypothetical protein D9757_000618 [Collybiopsis confluens]|uniref:Transglutaminase-like domain-containing protein n=1 Tax=Collybiopsis confluens TaxID=2823264 RepID=A0A8H5I1S8_9AGAR|nr:hypothetical protein D9757_000618 [Collybiopsis confluens]
MALRPPLPPRRSTPPPPPPRRAAPSSSELNDASQGIAARIGSLQLHVGRSPMTGRAERKVPVTPEQEEDEEVIVRPKTNRRPTWDDIKVRGEDYVQAISRRPPPIPSTPTAGPARRLPPKPARLPTPPPEPEIEPEPVIEHEESESSTTCIKCHDFSFVDAHAAQFPRETVASLDQLAYDLTCPWENETEKFRAIFCWLHHNIAYDADAFFCGNVQASTPESTLRSGLAVCDGYAGLFASLADRAGLQSMRIGGHGKGFGYIPTEQGGPVPQYQGNHAWNCALMDGEWRLVDSCWGAGAVSSEGYIKGFNPTWFTFTNAQFGKRHYPEDPSYQLISGEEGGPISWKDYILEDEGPQIFGPFHTNNYSPFYLQPSAKYIQSGAWVTFYLFKVCEHLSTDDADNYVAFISLPDQSRTPLTFNVDSGGWSASVYIPSGGDISLYYVTEVSGQDAKGLGVKGFNSSIGRKAMQFGGLCRWIAV